MIEELFWGDAGLGMAIVGSNLAAVGIAASGTPRAGDGVGAAVLRHRRRPQARCVLRLRARRRLRRGRLPHVGQVRRGQGRVGAQRHQGLDHQRWHRRHPRGGWRGRPRARLEGARQLRRSAGHARPLSMGQKYKKHGIRASHTAEVVLDDVRVPGSLPARRQGEARRAPRPGP